MRDRCARKAMSGRKRSFHGACNAGSAAVKVTAMFGKPWILGRTDKAQIGRSRANPEVSCKRIQVNCYSVTYPGNTIYMQTAYICKTNIIMGWSKLINTELIRLSQNSERNRGWTAAEVHRLTWIQLLKSQSKIFTGWNTASLTSYVSASWSTSTPLGIAVCS